MRGQFILPKRGLIIPNIIVEEGAVSFMRMITQANVSDVSSGGNFFLGLCGENGVGPTATLASITDELSATNGYAREAFTRDTTGWPTQDIVNGQARAKTKTITFTASGGDFSAAYSRLFICNVASGASGILYSFSSRVDPAILVLNGNDEDLQYEFFL